jgi:2-keto-4-pentenoate hydratase/2-oxohepta-3-ene-1,7-dioic acid hydratase in catechol pathway
MRICRFKGDRLGVVEGEHVADVTAALDAIPPARWPAAPGDALIANLPALRARIAALLPAAPRVPLSGLALNSPIANPPRIIAAPLNYRAHVEESADPAINHGVHMPDHEGFATPVDKMGVFLKSPTGVVGAAEGIALRFAGRRNDHEIELGCIIGTGGAHIAEADALRHVAGWTVALDMTVRGPEDRSFRKSADGYSVLGPWLVTADELGDHTNLAMELTVNGETRQRANTRDLLYTVPRLIALASSVYALHPGDVIMTGTPDGVGPVQAGDVICARIERIGELVVACR